MTNNPQTLRAVAAELIKAAEMLEHNAAIFKGKWKKGSKAWSGDFIERIVRDAFARIGLHTEVAELAVRIGDVSAKLATATIERDSLRTAFENEKATSIHLEELVEAERAEKNALMADLRKCEQQLIEATKVE